MLAGELGRSPNPDPRNEAGAAGFADGPREAPQSAITVRFGRQVREGAAEGAGDQTQDETASLRPPWAFPWVQDTRRVRLYKRACV